MRFVVLALLLPTLVLIFIIGATSGTIPMTGSWSETMLVVGIVWLLWKVIKFFRDR